MRFVLAFLLLHLATPTFAQDGFTPLFNGKDLSGWDGEPGLWKVVDGVIVGTSEVGKPKTNSFLIWNGKAKDFELRATVKVVGDNNSGLQYRSRRLPEVTPWTILGYQCDVHPTDVHTAMTYEERGRGIFGYNGVDVVMDPTGQRWQVGERPRVQADISQWNEFTVIARGNRLEHKVNGQTTSIFIDHDEKGRALEGLIAIQLHAGNPHQTYVKQVLLKVLTDSPLLPFDEATLPAGSKKIEKPKVVSAQGKTAPAQKATPAPAAAVTRPNILHIHADDHRADGLGALGAPGLRTPNLDILVARGMTFTRAYTQGSMIGAVCTPSRTMMLTGRSWQRIPGAPGARPEAADPTTFLPSVMAEAGYRTWHMGKAGNGFPQGLRTFQTTIADEGKSANDPATNRAYCSQRLADRTIAFLKEQAARKDGAPFYAYLAPPVPHDPRSAEPRFHAMYEASQIPLSPAFMPSHPWDNGEMTVLDERLAPWPRTPEDTRQQTADYYACVTGFDHHIGRIFAALKETGQWENTIIVFSGDNGLSLGEHGLFGKQNLYEYGGMHVPLVIAGPGIPHGRTEAFAYLMDLFPTFTALAGAKTPAGVEGQNLLPVMRGEKPSVRETAYLGYRNCMRAVSNGRWKLIRYPLIDRTQLFDLQTDPKELINLAEQPEHAARKEELMRLLSSEMQRYGDTHPLTVAQPSQAEWTPPTKAELTAQKADAKVLRKKDAAAKPKK